MKKLLHGPFVRLKSKRFLSAYKLLACALLELDSLAPRLVISISLVSVAYMQYISEHKVCIECTNLQEKLYFAFSKVFGFMCSCSYY